MFVSLEVANTQNIFFGFIYQHDQVLYSIIVFFMEKLCFSLFTTIITIYLIVITADRNSSGISNISIKSSGGKKYY